MRTSVPEGLRVPHLDPRRFFGAAELARNARYERFLRWDALAALAAQFLALALLARRARLHRGPALVRASVLGLAAIGVAWLAAFPFAAGAHWWNVRHGIARSGWGEWLLARLPGLGAELAAGAVLALVFVALARRLPQRWWLGAWALTVAIAAGFAFLEPYAGGAAPLHRPRLAVEVRRLERIEGAERVRLRVDRVHDVTRAANAEAVGFGPTATVVYWDTLFREGFTRRELSVLSAHELAHHRRLHILKGLAWFALLALPALLLLSRLVRLDDPAQVPRAALVLLVLQLLTLPLANAISRRYEREADWNALRATHDPTAAVSLFRRFAATSLDDPQPPWWNRILLEDHPGLLERIELARSLEAGSRAGS